jgi:hypothetical protein
MSWKKILALSLVLAALVAVIVLVNRHEKGKKAVEGILLDIPAASVEKIELRNKNDRFVFSRRDTLWYLDEPLSAKADKVTLENILDNFCQLKYDRLVEEDARDLKDFGLDKPETELKLVAKGGPIQVILLGMKNGLDDSSYAKLAAGGKVVSIAAYKRNDLEKDLFAFRDKKFLEIDTTAVTALEYRHENSAFAFSKVGEQWFMEKPVYSLAQEARVGDILSSASLLEALSFAGTASTDKRREFGLENPLLTAEFHSAAGSRKIAVGRKGERYYALADGATEICEVGKDFPDKFSAEPATFREKKVAPFYAFDVREIKFRRGDFNFEVRKNSAGTWEFAKPLASLAGKKPSEEKLDSLLTALADCEAKEFIDGPKSLPEFAFQVELKTEDPADSKKTGGIVMEFSAANGETAIARNPALPYCFKIGKEILEKFPGKIEDISEEISKIPNTGK